MEDLDEYISQLEGLPVAYSVTDQESEAEYTRKILVKPLKRNEFSLDWDIRRPIEELKKRIYELQEIAPESQRLLYERRPLGDKAVLVDKDHSVPIVLHLVEKTVPIDFDYDGFCRQIELLKAVHRCSDPECKDIFSRFVSHIKSPGQ